MTNKQKYSVHKKVLSDQFYSKIECDWLQADLQQAVYNKMVQRLSCSVSRKQFSQLKGISEATIKRIENGSCYDLKLIGKYLK